MPRFLQLALITLLVHLLTLIAAMAKAANAVLTKQDKALLTIIPLRVKLSSSGSTAVILQLRIMKH